MSYKLALKVPSRNLLLSHLNDQCRRRISCGTSSKKQVTTAGHDDFFDAFDNQAAAGGTLGMSVY